MNGPLVNSADAGKVPTTFNFEGLTLFKALPDQKSSLWNHGAASRTAPLWLVGIMLSTPGFDGTLLNLMRSLPQWNAYFEASSDSTWIVNILNGVFSLIGNFSLFWSAKKLGQSCNVFASYLFIIITSMLQGTHNQAFWVCQIIQGLSRLVFSAVSPYTALIGYPIERGMTFYASSRQVGGLLAAAINYGLLKIEGTWSCKVSLIDQAVPSLIQVITNYFNPRSSKWLVYKDIVDSAYSIVVKNHARYTSQPGRMLHFEMILSLQQDLVNADKWFEWVNTTGLRHRLALDITIPMSLPYNTSVFISSYIPVFLALSLWLFSFWLLISHQWQYIWVNVSNFIRIVTSMLFSKS